MSSRSHAVFIIIVE
jgi:hypothetical protein